MTQKSRLFWWWVVPLILVSFWLGAHGLNQDALWGDEYLSVQTIGWPSTGVYPPAQIWSSVSTFNSWHTPGYFIMLSGWVQLVGWEPPAMRALSLFFGVMALAWTYRLGRETLSARVGLFAAITLSTSVMFIHYYHDLRMYSLEAFFTAFTVWAYYRVIRPSHQPRKQDWLALFIGTVGLLYTQYFAALVLVVIGLYQLLFVRKDRRWWQVVGCLAAGGLVFVPWMPSFLDGLNRAEAADYLNERALTADEVVRTIAYLFTNGFVPLLVVLLFALRARGRNVRDAWLFPIVLLIIGLAVNAVMQVILAQRVRYLISLWPLVSLLVGLGIVEIGRYKVRGARIGQVAAGAILAVWFALGLVNSLDLKSGVTYFLDGVEYTFPMNTARDLLKPRTLPDDTVVSYLPDPLGEWMYKGIDHFYYWQLPVGSILMENKNNAERQEEQTQQAMSIIGTDTRVWIAYQPDPPPSTMPGFTDVLTSEFGYCGAVQMPTVRLDLYARSPVCCEPDMVATRPLAQFGSSIALTGVDMSLAPVGGQAPIVTGWEVGADVPPNTYSVALHVYDETGQLLAQSDYGLPSDSFSCQQTQIDVSALPPGEYTVNTMVYNWQTSERLPEQDNQASEPNNMFSLGTLSVP